MCGINGIYAPSRCVEVDEIRKMNDALVHRGPDDAGIEIIANQRLGLGHRRLSILDLSPSGHQPMRSADGLAWTVFNGEIYNFREIRSELFARGYSFRGHSDTEVMLAAYSLWGLESVSRFRGMFAYVIWDERSRLLHLCRDRFGVKPLFYSVINGVLAFSSEIKALCLSGHTSRAVDPVSIAEFVQRGYVSSPRSVYADIQSVDPGQIVSFDANLKRTMRQYWDARTLFVGGQADNLRRELANLPEDALLDRAESALAESFNCRMVADVPVGLFLSGGIDSSLVAALLARKFNRVLNTFTIGYGASDFDETAYARTVAQTLGARHLEFIVSPEAALEVAHEIPGIAGEPIGDSSLIPTLLVSRMARQHVKVALSADGADELFGGYARYAYCGKFFALAPLIRSAYALSAQLLDQLPPSMVASAYSMLRRSGSKYAGITDKMRKFVRMTRGKHAFEAYDAISSEWAHVERQRLLGSHGVELDLLNDYRPPAGVSLYDQFMHYDLTHYLPGDLLTKVDRASMFASLEARDPFLDYDVARIAAVLPAGWKIRDGQGKYLLRRLLARYFPESLFDRPKHGFSAPIGLWLRGPMQGVMEDYLSPARVRRYGLLDAEQVQKVLRGYLHSSRPGSASGMWILLQLQQWAERWLDGPGWNLQPTTAARVGT